MRKVTKESPAPRHEDPLPQAPVQVRVHAGRSRNPDRGLPNDEALVGLAHTYLTAQRQLWPALAKDGTLPLLNDDVLAAMADSFRRGFLDRAVAPFKPPSGKPTWAALAASYIRYSDENSNPRSLDQQLNIQLTRAVQNNHFIPWTYVFADAAVTATTSDRHGYDLAKKALGLDDVKVLYIDEIGRASRDAVEALLLGKLVERLGKRLIGVSDGYDSTGPAAKMQLSMYGMMQEWFVDQLRSKVHRGMDDAFDRGTNIHALPVGYDLVPATDGDGRPFLGKDGKQVNMKVINLEEAEHVLWAFQAFGLEGKTPNTIARRFNELSVAGKQTWDDGMVRQMLRRYTYVGIEIYGRTHQTRDPETGKVTTKERPRGEWQVRRMRSTRFVSWSLWKAVQRRLEVVKAANGRGLKPGAMTQAEIYPTFLIRPVCGSCGSNLVLGRSGKHASFYCMHGMMGKKGCKYKGYKTVRIVEDAVLAVVRGTLFTPEFLARVLESANQYLEEDADRPSEDVAPLEAEIRKLKSKADRLAEIIDNEGEEGLELLTKKLRGHGDRLKALRERLAQLKARNEPAPPPLTAADVQALLDDLRGLLDQDVAIAAPALKKLTGPVVVDQILKAGKSKPTWIGRFTLNAASVLVDLAASRNCPTRRTWEYLNKRGWTMPEPAEARLEPVLLHELHAPRVVELVDGGMSLNRVSAALGITWLTAKEALDYARAAGVSSGPVPSSLAVPSEEEEAHRPRHATEAARLKDEEKMSFAEIGAKLGISESTARRTYDWARREKMVAAAGASRAPVPDRVKLAPRAAL